MPEKTRGDKQLGFKAVLEIIELNCKPLILHVSWVSTRGVAASTPIPSSVTLSVFAAVTDSPGVTLRLQCAIRHPRSRPQWLAVRETEQPSNPLKPSMPHPPVEFTLCLLGQNLETANDHVILLSL